MSLRRPAQTDLDRWLAPDPAGAADAVDALLTAPVLAATPRLAQQEVIDLLEALAGGWRAGASSVSTLATLAAVRSGTALEPLCHQLATLISHGTPLAEALRMHQASVGPGNVALVAAAESAADPDRALSVVARLLRADIRTNAAIREALTFPALAGAVLALVTAGLSFVLAPLLTIAYRPADVPTLSAWCVTAGKFVPLALAVAVLAGLALRAARHAPLTAMAVQERIDRRLLTVPGLATLVAARAEHRLADLTGLLCQNGVPVLTALEISAPAAGNAVLTQRLLVATARARTGRPLAEALEDWDSLGSRLAPVLAAGIGNGNLPEGLAQLSQDSADRAQLMAQRLAHRSEPLVCAAAALGLSIWLALALGPLIAATAGG